MIKNNFSTIKYEKRFLLVLALAIILVLLPGVFAYTSSSFSYLGSQGINLGGNTGRFVGNTCSPGQDFVVQVAPLGCSPTVVRSDLLEEQNVPVFCQLSATQINPLVDVKAIDRIAFSGDYPEGVSGVGFHPAQAALSNSYSTLLNSPILNNIGYAVVVLKQEPVEANMPDFIEGNLTATLRYDIENAFGIGKANFLLPQMNDNTWQENYNQYGFWQGRGFIKAESIEDNSATISVYSDANNRVSTSTLSVGETSELVSLPSLSCSAGLNVHLDRLEAPDTRARLNINGDIVEVNEGSRFLDNKCSLSDVSKKGFSQSVSISCNTDEGTRSTLLRIDPKIDISIEGAAESHNVGDFLYRSDDGWFVYLGYTGNPKGTLSIKDSYIVLVSSPLRKERLDESELNTIAFQIENKVNNNGVIVGTAQTLASLANVVSSWVIDGKSVGTVAYGETKKVFGKEVGIVGFSGAEDLVLSETPSTAEKEFISAFQTAGGDYQSLMNSFNEIKINQGETYGERALINYIDLAKKTDQKKIMSQLCAEYKKDYGSSGVLPAPQECNNDVLFANSEVSTRTFSFNGFAKSISLEGIVEPTFDELGASIIIEGDGKTETVPLRLNQRYSLDSFRTDKSQIYVVPRVVDNSIFFDAIRGIVSFYYKSYTLGLGKDMGYYFSYKSGQWAYSPDGVVWFDVAQLNTDPQAATFLELVRRSGDQSMKLIFDLNGKDFNTGKSILVGAGSSVQDGSEFIQLIDIRDNSVVARISTHVSGVGADVRQTFLGENVRLLNIGESTNAKSDFVFTLTKTNVKKFARVSIIPKVDNTGTEANFTFKIGIEKRAIQLSPDEIQSKLDNVKDQVATWGNISDTLGTTVSGFKAACFTTGAFLTVKNLIENVDGSALARKEVMRGPGGWADICEKEAQDKGITVDECFTNHATEIDNCVEGLSSIIQSQETSGAITKDNVGTRLGSVKTSLGDSLDKTGAASLNLKSGSSIDTALSQEGFSNSLVGLSDAKDIERWTQALKSNSCPQVQQIAQNNLYAKLSDIGKTADAFTQRKTTASDLGIDSSKVLAIQSRNLKKVPYSGTEYSNIISGTGSSSSFKTPSGFDVNGNTLTQVVVDEATAQRYVLFLDGDYVVRGTYKLDSSGNLAGLDSTDLGSLSPSPGVAANEKNPLGLSFQKYDKTSYTNPFKTVPKVKYFETDPYKGLPAFVPFDTKGGWYVQTNQLGSSTLGLPKTSGAFDDSGRAASFTICNVGADGKPDLSEGSGDDICRSFDVTSGRIYGEFPGLSQSETDSLVRKATSAIKDAANAYKPGVSGKINIGGEYISVGEPAANVPQIQCQDFMSPSDCNLLFNVCDPVVCPSSRCDLGGNYHVDNVVQTGIVGGLAMCLPNFPEVKVPICLSGVKAGVDGLLSVYQNYEDCLQEQLDSGKTVGICDEVYSVYMCDFFWSQSIPIIDAGVPALIDKLTGKSNAGGGEYLGFQSAWKNAESSVDYLTTYYGPNSLKSFQARTTDEAGTEFCKAFVSARYPSSASFFDQLLQPDSPSQYHGWFEEIPFTTATVPPTSQYKVFYHIFAGGDSGAYYNVYLKSPEGTSFFQSSSRINVASGYINKGDYASETIDFTDVSGYQELCINVNGKDDCGFKQVSTSFAVNYASDQFIKAQASNTNIQTADECVSGSANIYGLINPNLQAGATNALDPQLRDNGIVRVCSTDNPGLSTDPLAGTQNGRWQEVGYCDENQRLKCYLDTQSVKDVVDFNNAQNAILSSVGDYAAQVALQEGQYYSQSEFDKQVEDLNKLDSSNKINQINLILGKVFFDFQKARLILIRGDAWNDIAVKNYIKYNVEKEAAKIGSQVNSGTSKSKSDVCTPTTKGECNSLDVCYWDDQLKECSSFTEETNGISTSSSLGTQTLKTYNWEKGDRILLNDGGYYELINRNSDGTFVVDRIPVNSPKDNLNAVSVGSLNIIANSANAVSVVSSNSVPKLSSITQQLTCESCGDGGLNLCDETECNDISKNTGLNCEYKSYLLFGSCVESKIPSSGTTKNGGTFSTSTTYFNEQEATNTKNVRITPNNQLDVGRQNENFYVNVIFDLSGKLNLDFNLVRSLISQESFWNPNAGPDIGLLQVTPSPNMASDFDSNGVCRKASVGNGNCGKEYPQSSIELEKLTESERINMGMCYLACLRDYYGITDPRTLVAAYNAGPGIKNKACKSDYESCTSEDFSNRLTLNVHVPNIEKYYSQYFSETTPSSEQPQKILDNTLGGFDFSIGGQPFSGNELRKDQVLSVKISHSCFDVQTDLRASIILWPDKGSNVLTVGNSFNINGASFNEKDKFYLRTYCLDENRNIVGKYLDSKVFTIKTP